MNLKSSDFELLCPKGGRVAVDKFSDCNLAREPAHMVSASRKSYAQKLYITVYLLYAIISDESTQWDVPHPSTYHFNPASRK